MLIISGYFSVSFDIRTVDRQKSARHVSAKDASTNSTNTIGDRFVTFCHKEGVFEISGIEAWTPARRSPIPPNFFIRRPSYGIWQAAGGIAFQTETTTGRLLSFVVSERVSRFATLPSLCRSFTCPSGNVASSISSHTAKRPSRGSLVNGVLPCTRPVRRSTNSYAG